MRLTARSWPTMRCDNICSNSFARRPFCSGLRRTVSVKSVCLCISISVAIMTVLHLLVILSSLPPFDAEHLHSFSERSWCDPRQTLKGCCKVALAGKSTTERYFRDRQICFLHQFFCVFNPPLCDVVRRSNSHRPLERPRKVAVTHPNLFGYEHEWHSSFPG